MSELVTNSLIHSGAGAMESVTVRMEVTLGLIWLEVEDPGCDGVIAPVTPDLEVGGGFGLNLVQALSRCWGVERIADGGTRVWAQLARAASSAPARVATAPSLAMGV